MNIFLIKKHLHYFFAARHARGHGIHSPFVYELIRKVFIDKKRNAEFLLIEKRRKILLKNSNFVEVIDLGAGSKQLHSNKRTIKSIAKSSLSPKKDAQFLFRLARLFNVQTILEMGTSLGISGAYLALSNPNAKLITLEGAPSIAELAKQTFEECVVTNAEVLVGNFIDTLPIALQKLQKIDMAFIDGNHQKQATLDYFEQIMPFCNEHSILIFDDIYWSEGMSEAWQHIKEDNRVSITIDICKLGIVFFRKGIIKQDFIIRF